MACAAPTASSSKETTNFARLCRLLVDVGTQALRDTFMRQQLFTQYWREIERHYSH